LPAEMDRPSGRYENVDASNQIPCRWHLDLRVRLKFNHDSHADSLAHSSKNETLFRWTSRIMGARAPISLPCWLKQECSSSKERVDGKGCLQ